MLCVVEKGGFEMKSDENGVVFGYAAYDKQSPLKPFQFKRRELGPRDVDIAIDYCGVCHSDLHQVRDEWGGSIYPMVPGHEIVGHVLRVGKDVTRFKGGDPVGVGCFVDSCGTCGNCHEGLEQYCDRGFVGTYNAREKDGVTPTYGGYSKRIVVHSDYVLSIPKNLPAAAVAPLLCAGITTYSPLRQWQVKAGSRVAVVGLGGLGHMAVRFARSFGAEVTVITTSERKSADARRLGATDVLLSSNPEGMALARNSFDFILDTVSAPKDLVPYLDLVKRDGTMVMVGIPTEPLRIPVFGLVMGRRRLAGSLIGGIKETQEMLDYCGLHGITADVEVISITDIETAYQRMLKGDVAYRFVIDLQTLKS